MKNHKKWVKNGVGWLKTFQFSDSFYFSPIYKISSFVSSITVRKFRTHHQTFLTNKRYNWIFRSHFSNNSKQLKRMNSKATLKIFLLITQWNAFIIKLIFQKWYFKLLSTLWVPTPHSLWFYFLISNYFHIPFQITTADKQQFLFLRIYRLT